MKKNSINYNFIMNLIYNIALYIFPLITYPYVTRILNPDGIGKVTFAQSFSTYFSMIAIFGLTTYASRGVACIKREKKALNKFVTEILVLEIVLSMAVFFVYMFTVLKVPILQNRKNELLLMSVNIFTGGVSVGWLYTGLEKFDVLTKRFLVCKTVSVLILFVTVHNQNDFLWYAVFTFLSDTAVNIWNICTMGRYVNIDFSHGLHIFYHLKKCLAFFAATIANCLYTNLDSIMLTFISGNVQTGFYTTALKIRQLLSAVVLSFARVLLPRISYELANDNEKNVNRLLQKAMHITLLLSSFFSVFCLGYAEDIMILFAGREFAVAANTLRWTVASVIVFSISAVYTEQIFPAYGMEKYVTVFIGTGACVDLVLNAVFMPKWGAAGGAAATFFTEVVVLGLVLRKARDLGNNYFKDIRLKKLSLLVIIECVWLILSQKLIRLNYIFRLLFAGIVYVILFVIVLLLQHNSLVLEAKRMILRKIKR